MFLINKNILKTHSKFKKMKSSDEKLIPLLEISSHNDTEIAAKKEANDLNSSIPIPTISPVNNP